MMQLLPLSGQRQGFKDLGNTDPGYLPIAAEYRPLFERLATTCQTLRGCSALPPEQLALLAKLHYALARLPVLTRDVEFFVILADPHDRFGQWLTYTLEISPRLLRATKVFHSQSNLGGIRPIFQDVFHAESNGYRHDDGQDGYHSYAVFAQWVQGWEALCQHAQSHLIIFNQRELFDWRQTEDPLAWEKMPSLFESRS